MPNVPALRPMTHLPAAPPSLGFSSANSNGRPSQIVALAAPLAGSRSLILAGKNVKIDPTVHTAENVVSIINAANIPGVGASLDRDGNLQITGVATASGDTLLLQHLGLA